MKQPTSSIAKNKSTYSFSKVAQNFQNRHFSIAKFDFKRRKKTVSVTNRHEKHDYEANPDVFTANIMQNNNYRQAGVQKS